MDVLAVFEMPMSVGMFRYGCELIARLNINLCTIWFDPHAERRYVYRQLMFMSKKLNLNLKSIYAIRFPVLSRTINQRIFAPFRLMRIVKRYRILHTFNHLSPGALRAGFIARVKTIATIHDIIPILYKSLYPDRWHLLPELTKLWRKCTILITPSESTKNDLINKLGLLKNKIHVIYPGVDHEMFKPFDKLKARAKLGLPEDKSIILYVGSAEPKRAIPLRVLIKAIKEISNAIFILAGPFKLLKLNSRKVKVIYNPTDAMLPLIYNAADVFVFPTLYEGFGIPCLEALACGIPVVAPKVSSIPEVVGDAGILIDEPLNYKLWKNALLLLLRDENLRGYLTKKALMRAKKFSWGSSATRLREIYEELLRR